MVLIVHSSMPHRLRWANAHNILKGKPNRIKYYDIGEELNGPAGKNY